jgi:hypothetical protein
MHEIQHCLGVCGVGWGGVGWGGGSGRWRQRFKNVCSVLLWWFELVGVATGTMVYALSRRGSLDPS